MSGSIPSKLYIASFEGKYDNKWTGESVPCHHAYFASASSEKACASALQWASQSGAPAEDEIDNLPIPTLRLVGLVHRQEGGFVLKVLYNEFLVDLREEEFNNVLFKKGIPADGTIVGPFCWALNGSQMRLCLVDGDIYRGIEAYQKAIATLPINQKPIKRAALVVGGIYVTKTQQKSNAQRPSWEGSVYLGACLFEGRELLAVAGVYDYRSYDEKIAGPIEKPDYQTVFDNHMKSQDIRHGSYSARVVKGPTWVERIAIVSVDQSLVTGLHQGYGHSYRVGDSKTVFPLEEVKK